MVKETKDKLWTLDFIKAGVAQFFMASSFHVLIPILPIYLSEALEIPHSKIGIVLSSYVLALLIIRPFSGYIVDVFPRKMIYMIGLFCFVTIFSGYLVAASIGLFIVFRFFHGLFWGITSVSANTIAIDIIPSSRRAEGIGYFGVTMNLAMAIAPFFAVELYNQYGFSVLVLLSMILGTMALITVAFMNVPKVIADYSVQKKAMKKPMSWDRFILRPGLPLFFNQLFITFGWGTIAAYAILYGQSKGFENSGYFFVSLAIGIMTARVLSGKLVDRGYLHIIVRIAIATVAIAFISFGLLETANLFFISALLLGLGFGALLPALQTLYINMAGPERRGTANATYLTGFDLGIGMGMLIGARIADIYNFEMMYFLAAGLNIIALLLYHFMSMKVYEKRKLVK